MKKVAVYCRVSTQEQNVDSQLNAVKTYVERQGWKIVKTYKDEGVSGSQDNRDALNRLKKDCLKARRGWDGVVVYKFDRMARSSSHLLECLQLFHRHGIDFVSVTEGIDTSSSVGKMVYTFLSAIAEFERSIIQERVKSGMERAKREGRHVGRPRVGVDVERVMKLRRDGLGVRKIADKIGVSHMTIHNVLSSVKKGYEIVTV